MFGQFLREPGDAAASRTRCRPQDPVLERPTMQDIRFLWPADEAIASLSPATREAITAAVQDAADDGASFARLGYALARAAGMVAVVQPGGGGTVEVLALVSETDWETNAAHCT